VHTTATAAAVVLIGMACAAGCGGGDDEMPDVTGETREDAVEVLRELELIVTVAEEPRIEENGTIVVQQPEAGRPLPEDRRVSLTVAAPPLPIEDTPHPRDIRVPDVVGLPVDRAEQVLAEHLLAATAVTPRESNLPSSIVIEQKPRAGELATLLGVTLVVSERDTVPAPNLVGRTEGEAVAELQSLGLQVGDVETVLEGNGPVGQVLEQSPGPASPVLRRSTVRLVVKEEGVRVPSVLNQTMDQVGERMFASDLSFMASWVIDRTKPEGTIVGMRPGPNELVPRRSRVDVVVTRHSLKPPGQNDGR
jgi:serine/threonine-protein kinase